MLNMEMQNLDFAVPSASDKQWYIVADTSRYAPDDIADAGQEHPFHGQTYHVEGHSVVVLLAK